jgi:DNA mismatch repair protein MutS2
MAMCGLLIPAADRSEIAIFDKVLVDVGDEQSIQQSLSTFSAHMVNIIQIMKEAEKTPSS